MRFEMNYDWLLNLGNVHEKNIITDFQLWENWCCYSKVHLPRLYVISVIRPIFNEIEIRISNNKILSKNIHQKEKDGN